MAGDKADSVHFLTPTDDNLKQCEGMKARGIATEISSPAIARPELEERILRDARRTRRGGWMTRVRLALFTVFISASSVAGPKTPAGVRSVPASAEVNAKARKKLELMFQSSPPALEAPDRGVLMLGPFLGLRLGGLDMSRFLPVDATVALGETTARTKTFGARTPDDARALLGLIRDYAPAPSPTIRPLSAAELTLVWPLVAWDLVEPIFIVETKSRKWVVNFEPEGERLWWIEDLSEPCFTTSDAMGTCSCLRADPKGTKWSVVLTRKSCLADEGPPTRSKDGRVELRLTQFLQPDRVMSGRMSPEEWSAYVLRLRATLETALPKTRQEPTALVVSVAVKEALQHRLWLTVSSKTPLSRAVTDALRTALMETEAPSARGLIVFQLHFQLFGGPPLPAETFESFPDEWRAVTTKHDEPVDVESLVLEAWD